MKKNLIWIVSCIVVGLIMGKIMFDQYDDNTKQTSAVLSEQVYLFQAGVYSNFENMKSAGAKYDNYIYMEKDSKYYLFIGITKSEENKEKLKQYFDSLSY